MPQPPGIIDRVNYVVSTWNNPCNAPWYVYIETARPAALEALTALACFDVDDVVRYIFRPAGLRGGGHLRTRGKGKGKKRKPRLGERIRNKIGPLAAIKNRKVTNGVKTLWVIDGIGQRLLWWWLVIDVGTGFVYGWTSQLYKTEFCQMALAPGSMGAETGPIPFGGIPHLQAVPWNRIAYQQGSVAGSAFSFSLGDGHWNIECGVTLFNWTSQPTTCGLQLNLSTPQGNRAVNVGPVTIQAGATASLMVSGEFIGPGGFGLEYVSDEGFVDLSGILYVQGQPTEGPPPPIDFECNSILWPDWG